MPTTTTPANRGRGVSHKSETAGAYDTSNEARIGQHIRPHPSGCWFYKGKSDGYITVRSAGRSVPLHRWVYETMVEPVEAGMHVHHKCQQPACCNPDHLEALTPKEHKAAHRLLDAS